MQNLLKICGYIVGGLFFLLMAFSAGTQKNAFWGCVSFVSFFFIAMMLFRESGRKDDGSSSDKDEEI
jgi:hypothetical protein